MGVKHIDITEFREVGFLQEANRLFFHPRGLALEVTICDHCEGSGIEPGTNGIMCQAGDLDCNGRGEWISGVWDYRDDPEGVIFGPDQLSFEKAKTVQAQLFNHLNAREKLGCDIIGVQPLI